MLFERGSAFLAILRIFIIEFVAIGATDFDDGLGQGIDSFARANVISKAALTDAFFSNISKNSGQNKTDETAAKTDEKPWHWTAVVIRDMTGKTQNENCGKAA